MPINNLEQIIKEKVNNHLQTPILPGSRVEKVLTFSTPLNENCAVVISKASLYAVRLVIYNPSVGEIEKNVKRYPDSNPLNGYSSLRKALRQAIDIKLEKEFSDTLETT